MEVFHFDKSMMERLEEAQNVLISTKTIQPSRVMEEWSYAIELLIEPTGWQAIWKISRVICDELKIKYPTIVYGTVTNVLFKDLKAIFTITAIQDDDIHLPEEHEVPLIDLWPTKIQENPAINIEATADCVDMIRFFFNNIWMPWDADSDEDFDWATKYLESRIRFCYDLKADMNPVLARRVRALIAEARDIQERKDYLELGLSDDEDMNKSKSQITDLMHFHLRMATIRNEIEMLENQKMRKIFEEIAFSEKKIDDISVVMHGNASLSQHIQDLEKARQIIGNEKSVTMSLSLQDSIMASGCVEKIYLPNGPHPIRFLDVLNSSIIGFTPCDNSLEARLKEDIDESTHSIISAKSFENILLTLNGRVEIKNVVLDCRKVRTGILVCEGSVRFENCTFFGDRSSSTSTSIIMLENATVALENCVIKDFSTGISMRGKSSATSLSLTNSVIYNSSTGIESNDKSCITFNKSKITNAKHYGIIATSDRIMDEVTKLQLERVDELKIYNIPITGDCEFQMCIPKNILVFNKGEMCLLANCLQSESFKEEINTSTISVYSSEVDESIIVIDEV